MNEFPISWLQKQGLDLPDQQLQELSDGLEDVLEMRVGYAISDHLSQEQLDDFEAAISDTDNPDAGLDWLQANYPNYTMDTKRQKAKLSRQIRSATNPEQTIRNIITEEGSSN